MTFRLRPASAALAVSLLLSACSSAPTVPTDAAERSRLYQAKAELLVQVKAWLLEGRLAVDNGKDGGSGNFRWSRKAAGSRMDFHGALGRGAWTLEATKQRAEITLADGSTHSAGTVEELVRREVGWQIPVDSLEWWVRGLAVPGKFRTRVLDLNGNLSELQQNGWTIRFDRYRQYGGISLPTRLTAEQAEWKVKLAIRSWELKNEGHADG